MRASGYVLLTAAIGVFVGGSFTGVNLLTSGASTTVDAPTCTPRVIEIGEDVTSNLVTVNVYNASRTAGLANRISILLQRRGFLAGEVANNPTDIETSDIVIVTALKNDARVKIVKAQFTGEVTYEEPPAGTPEDEISVLVGSNYATKGLRGKGKNVSSPAETTMTVCLPVLPVS